MNVLTDIPEKSTLKMNVAYAGSRYTYEMAGVLEKEFGFESFADAAQLQCFLDKQTLLSIPDVIMLEVTPATQDAAFMLIDRIKQNPVTAGLIVIFLSGRKDPELRKKAIAAKVHDVYSYPFESIRLLERIRFLIKFKLVKPDIRQLPKVSAADYNMSWGKRAFDILVSLTLIVLLLPVMLIVALLIKLDSKGPVIYKSKRAGTGYHVFDFYKFRSMRQDADKQLQSLSSLNQYAKENSNDSAFIKIKNDPRITKLGAFLRKTSLDELPQLFNVLKGDMSLVGNRPLPLYEAERLTSNEWSQRFLGPAGITGLWQISKRGKSEMSDLERRELDNHYAQHYSFWVDLKIMIKTIPAMLQKEKV